MAPSKSTYFSAALPLLYRKAFMDIKTPALTPRLRAVAELVRDGAFVADVGTDHAYLPIALVCEGRARGAVASDINKCPYLRAKQNVEEHSLEDKITTVHCAGLSGIDKFSPTDILICGMGGELIASIIEDAPFTKNSEVRLVLQPMTHAEILRKFLLDNDFEIICERVVKEEKLYQIICAEYRGDTKTVDYNDAELLIGRLNINTGGELLSELVCHHLKILENISSAKHNASADADFEDKLIEKLKEIKNDCSRALSTFR